MRPRNLDEVVGQKHLLGPGSPLRVLAGESGGPAGPSSVILWGPPGTGKTTLANVIAGGAGRKFVELSAITAGVKDVRAVMDQALEDRDFRGLTTVLFLDEIHRFTKAQQDALLPGVENRWVVLVAATTENPSFSVISPLLSRSILLTLQGLTDTDIAELLQRAVTDPRGFAGVIDLDDAASEHLVKMANGDARKALTSLEAAAAVAFGKATDAGVEYSVNQPLLVTAEHASLAVNRSVVRYDKQGDQHYDVTSAFIKSIRGSDVDAALHYLARMIEAGEDPRFIARRLIVHASEDIGMADPTALTAAVNAAQAVQLVGLPEARLNLAQATIHLASAPKSNAVYRAIDGALADVRSGLVDPIPVHLRDSHYPGADALGHGRGYIYPHDEKNGIARQTYAPENLQKVVYYRPSLFGEEKILQQRLERIRTLRKTTPSS
ncbi:MAG TPA: replication-associated recombination protein A [Candidatus Rothia avicola]|uniref:Replication-associated recombination protein A n=1 Tax=Candidatus Rothia avicola TaxID=2840478 RepID=A0A9D1ZRB2_9MICC|nr:replication-associated recombination protein A [Candidatus Rothia avicola]